MDYLGDLVNIKVDNNGNTPEYISFQVFFPKHVDILELNSKISGTSDQISSNEQQSSMLQQLASFSGDDLVLNELQTTSTKLTLRGGKHLELFFNYDADKFVSLSQSKFTNQFLSILEFYSAHPETISVGINSANFGHGNYPKISIHRWLLSTLPGYSLTINFKNVDLEENVDNIRVYSFNEKNQKTHIKSIRSVDKLSTESNKILIVFTSDCSENHRGFNATIHVNRITTTTEPTNARSTEKGTNETTASLIRSTAARNENATSQARTTTFKTTTTPKPVWSDWEEGVCSKAREGGSRTDTRSCVSGNCEGASEKTVDCNNRGCREAAVNCGSGVQDRSKIKDNQLSVSSYYHNEDYHLPRHGRLFGTSGVAAWMAG